MYFVNSALKNEWGENRYDQRIGRGGDERVTHQKNLFG